MKSRNLFKKCGLTILTLIIPAILTLNSFATWTPVNLGEKLGTNDSYADDINDKGQVVGVFTNSKGTYDGFVYQDGTVMTLSGLLGGGETFSNAINNNGQVAGITKKGGVLVPYIFTISTKNVKFLDKLDWTDKVDVKGMNDKGNVVGTYTSSDGYKRGFLFNGSSMQDLGNIGGGESSYISAINESSEMVGSAAFTTPTSYNSKHAFIYSNGVAKDLGTFGGMDSFALGINDNGDVVGMAEDSNYHFQSFIYSKSSGVITPLGNFGYKNGFTAQSINNKGQIVGYVQNDDYSYSGAIVENGVLTKLDVPKFMAYAINEVGDVVGASDYKAFLYTTSPVKNNSDTTAPSQPTSLKASSIATISLKLTWTASKDNVGIKGYEVYKKSGTKYVKIASITGTSYTVKNLKAKTSYTFYIKALDAAGNKSISSSKLIVSTKK